MRLRLSVIIFLLCGCSAATLSTKPQAVAHSTRGVVTSAEFHATQAGVRVLEEGGHAVDAAVTVALALAVTWPEAGNIGGGGFMLIRDKGGKAVVVDYRETAPASAHPEMFLNDKGDVDPIKVRLGHVVAGIPGTIAGLAKAHELYGRFPWHRLVQPAVQLARNGFEVDERIAAPLARLAPEMMQFPGSARVFYPNGKPLSAGSILKQPDLANVLEEIAESGPQAFYRGSLAARMANQMQSAGGIWTVDDLASYKAIVREPVRWAFRGHVLLSVPPPSSGGVALGQMLGMLEGINLGQTAQSVGYHHLLVEVMRRAFLERAMFLGDSDYTRVDMKKLLSPGRIANLRATIDPKSASSSEALAPPGLLVPSGKMNGSTTHFSVVDADGNAVSNTYTIEESWGSKAVLDGFGFLLNNELHDFNVKPGWTDRRGRIGTPPNIIAAGKRPLSSQTPSMVEKGGKLMAVVGSPGGRTIINTVLQVILNLVVWQKSPLEAVTASRIHHQWMPDAVYMEPGADMTLANGLRELGHTVRSRKWRQGHANIIVRDPSAKRWTAIADPRRGGHAQGF